MTGRTKTIMMVFGLALQLEAWITSAREFGHMTGEFRYESGILRGLLNKFLTKFGARDVDLYEHSVQVSDLFERIARLNDEQVKRVIGLLNKIEDDAKRGASKAA